MPQKGAVNAMKNKKNLLYLIGGLIAFAAVLATIVIFWEEITGFICAVRDKVIKTLDAISQRTHIDHYDEFEDYSDYIEE